MFCESQGATGPWHRPRGSYKQDWDEGEVGEVSRVQNLGGRSLTAGPGKCRVST